MTVVGVDLEQAKSEEQVEPTLFDLEIHRDESGVVLKLKSEIFEKFMRSNSAYRPHYENKDLSEKEIRANYGVRTSFPGIKNEKIYMVKNPPTNGLLTIEYNDMQLLYGDTPNMVFLCMMGISEGLEIKVPGFYTEKQLQRFAQRFKESAIDFHRQCMRTYSLRYSVTMKEVV